MDYWLDVRCIYWHSLWASFRFGTTVIVCCQTIIIYHNVSSLSLFVGLPNAHLVAISIWPQQVPTFLGISKHGWCTWVLETSTKKPADSLLHEQWFSLGTYPPLNLNAFQRKSGHSKAISCSMYVCAPFSMWKTVKIWLSYWQISKISAKIVDFHDYFYKYVNFSPN